ncbi:hypothetical protein EC991_000534 [Linnemannia zychae]|nr:hypothetical protein EC991_000534 [Linnemannia zychae]
MAAIWHPVPGRLQSVSVADKDNIWGVTLDLQLCKFDLKLQQWQLVSVTSETINQARFSSSSAQSSASTSSSTLNTARKFASYLPTLGLTSTATPASTLPDTSTAATTAQQTPRENGNTKSATMSRANSSRSLLGADAEEDTTIQVSAASDGTVVRLDRSLKAWYLIAPHSDYVDYEKDVIWIDLGHFWKCVSVASISQIWGLSDSGDIYYGTSDRFALLEHAITSGAGYSKPTFTHISVGHDNVVLATDAHTGTVFRLKLHATGSCPPVWTALTGTGPGSSLHILNCSLSTADFIVGVAKDGRVYRYSHSVWTPLGGGAKLDNVGVGIDGYVLGVDRDGDLFGCQLESTTKFVTPLNLDRPSSREWTYKAVKDDQQLTPSSPQAPNGPGLFNAPRQQGMSKRPASSPRELFEMAASSTRESPTVAAQRNRPSGVGELRVDTTSKNTAPSPLREVGRGSSWVESRSPHVFSKMPGLDRSDSQMSKRSYASDIAISKTPTGLSLSQPSTPVSSRVPEGDISSYSNEQPIITTSLTTTTTLAAIQPESTQSRGKASPLRILTKSMPAPSTAPLSTDRESESYFTSKPITTLGPSSILSPMTSFPLDGNPYAAGSKPSSNHSVVQTPVTPHSSDSYNNNNTILSTSTKSSDSSHRLSMPGHHAISPEEAQVPEEVEHGGGLSKADNESTSSLSPLDNVPSVVHTGLGQQDIKEEQLKQQQPDGSIVETGQGLAPLMNADSGTTVDDRVELARVYEDRDYHRDEDPLPSTAIDTEAPQQLTQSLPLTTPDVIIPSNHNMESRQLLSNSGGDKGEWIENEIDNDRGGDVGHGRAHGGVNIAGHRNNDDGHVWNGDAVVVQSNLDQDKRMPFAPEFIRTESSQSPTTEEGSTGPTPLQPFISRTPLPFHSTENQQGSTQAFEQQQQQQQQNELNGTFTNRQPSTSNFLSWDTKEELFNNPSPTSPLDRQFYYPLQNLRNTNYPPSFQPRQDLLSQHRPSDSSEVLMLQQQEFLRQTRLRSQPSSVVIGNDPALNNISAFYTDKAEVEPQDYLNNEQFQQQGQQNQQHYHNVLPPPQPSNYNSNSGDYNNDSMLFETRLNNREQKDENRRQSLYIPSSTSTFPFSQSLEGQQQQVQQQQQQQQQKQEYDDAPPRPSYSETHLHHYVETQVINQTTPKIANHHSMAYRSAAGVNDNADGTSVGAGRGGDFPTSGTSTGVNLSPGHNAAYLLNNPRGNLSDPSGGLATRRRSNDLYGRQGINSNGTTTTLASTSTRTGGIQGEDAQGRWIGSPTGPDQRVINYPSEIHKSRCCIIQ